MKQRITVEQLNELTEDQKKRLQELWKIDQHSNYLDEVVVHDNEIVVPTEYDDEAFHYAAWSAPKFDCLPLLSIGQMFEFLAHGDADEPTRLFDVSPSLETWTADEMCDELWKLVKRFL